MSIKKEKRRVIKNALIKQIQVLTAAQSFTKDCLKQEQDWHEETMNKLKESNDLLIKANSRIKECLNAIDENTKLKAKVNRLRNKIKKLKNNGEREDTFV